MEPRTTTIQINGEPREVFADKAAMLRFERSGGNLRNYEAKPLDTATTFLFANLVERREGETDTDVYNGLDTNDLLDTFAQIASGSMKFEPDGQKKSSESGSTDTAGQSQ